MRCSNMAADSKTEKTWDKPDRYTAGFTAKNTFTDNYGALLLQARTQGGFEGVLTNPPFLAGYTSRSTTGLV